MILRTTALTVLLFGGNAFADECSSEKITSYLKTTSISKLDTQLPPTPFNDWLIQQFHFTKVEWEGGDCGEQTGTSADRGRDFPLCADFTGTLPDGKAVFIRTNVGSVSKCISGSPETTWIEIRSSADPFEFRVVKEFKKLHELASFLKRSLKDENNK